MKPFIIFISMVILVCLNSCADKSSKLYIYNWTYYMPDTVLQLFEKEFNCRIIYDMYASNEEMFAKLKAGGTGYDLVFPAGDHVSIMAREGMLMKLDHSKLNVFGSFDSLITKKITYDPGFVYSVPYCISTTGIAVNKKKVPNFERSWKIFADSSLKGRTTLMDDMRDVFGAACLSLGYNSVNVTDPAKLDSAKAVISDWSKNIVKFDSEAFAKGFAAGEFWVVHGYSENIFLELDSSMINDVEFFIPKEGVPLSIDNMVILKDAKNVDLAYQFINFIHRPEIYSQICDYLGAPSLNIPARAKMTKKPHYTIEDLGSSDIKNDVGASVELYNKLWQEIRIGK